MEIRIVKEKISKAELKKIAENGFGDIIKGTGDIKKEMLALGGELHSDSAGTLIEEGSNMEDIWGFNLYPDFSEGGRVDFVSLLNIKPSLGNRSMEIENPGIKEKLTKIIDKLIEW